MTASLLGCMALAGCQGGEMLGSVEIERLSRQMVQQFEDQRPADNSDMFSDTAVLYAPGGYRAQGKEVIRAYWGRYMFPERLEWETILITDDWGELERNPDFLSVFGYVRPLALTNGEMPSLYQWARWRIVGEREDAVNVEERFPVLLEWVQPAGSGWQIRRLWMG